MKKQTLVLSFTCFLFIHFFTFAQDNAVDILAERNPTVDYTQLDLTPTAKVPDYATKAEQLKLTGIVYESDGVTPAKDVIVFIEQADEDGDFEIKKLGKKRYLHHKAMVKTDADGRYTFYTFIPGNDRRYNQLQQLFPVVKAPSKKAYEIESFLFDNDPLLTRMCRKKLRKKGDVSRILSLTKEENMFIATKDIVLKDSNDQTSL